MIYVCITDKLKTFETDIRDLCLAFFSLQKITYVFDDIKDVAKDDIVIKDYFNGSFEGERIKVKGDIKRQLYNYLSRLTGKKLLWGTLTGIRPVTIVTKIIEDKIFAFEKEKKNITKVFGLSPITEIDNNIYKENEKIKEYLKEEYYISDEKADELIRIARNEIEVLDRETICDYKNSYSIYVGVPFCKSTCLYCSFTSFNIDKYEKYVDKYLSTLENEFKSKKKEFSNVLQPLSIYIGGGTPTSLDEKSFEKLLDIINRNVDMSRCVEYTVEAGRPDTITKEKLLIMKKYNVNRISINPQSFNQKTLDLIGRKHKVQDVIEKFKLARSLGFDNINMDIILGLPNEHLLNVLKTLNEVRKLKPDSFTVHSLALKRAARLNFELDDWMKNSYLAGMDNKAINKMFNLSKKLAEHLNLKPYYLYRQKNMAGNLENVGYAKRGKECVYNIMMMSERHSIYGFGTATTKRIYYEDTGKRIESEEGYKSVVDYCANGESYK